MNWVIALKFRTTNNTDLCFSNTEIKYAVFAENSAGVIRIPVDWLQSSSLSFDVFDFMVEI